MFKNFIYGLIIGLGFIIPGVSGGVLATILGVYETILNKLQHLFHDFKNNLIYLTPLFLGIIISIFLFSNLILYLLNNKYVYISYVFIGLIIGCLPYLLQEIKNRTQKRIAITPFLITLLFGIFLFIIEKSNTTISNEGSFLIMMIAGFLYAIGKLVPGISGAALLMLIGVYQYFLEIISHPFQINFAIICHFIPFFISFFLSAILIIKLMNFALQKHFRITYSGIIGFVIASILFLYPSEFNLNSLIILICSFLISYHLSINKK